MRLRIYRHAFAAILLLLWQWVGALDTRLHGTLSKRLLSSIVYKEPQPWRPLETPLVRLHLWLFKTVQGVFPECYSDEAIFGKGWYP
jgi:hypothetical protein